MAQLTGELKIYGANYGFDLIIPLTFPIPITKSIADIREPASRQSAISKTVTIDATEDVNSMFKHIYEINKDILDGAQFVPDFNPNKRVSVEYSESGILQFVGFMRLMNIVKRLETSKITYECQIFNDISDFWNIISPKSMADIDLTKYNHNLTGSLVRKSWDQNIVLNGVEVPFAKGKGYVHGLVNKLRYGGLDGSPDPTTDWKVGNTTPMIYAKELVDAIYLDSGNEYAAGGFFDTAEFKNWVVPYNGIGLDLSSVEINNEKLIAQTTAPITDIVNFPVSRPTTGQIIYQNDSTGGNQDLGGNYNNVTGDYTVPLDGTYSLIARVDYTIELLLATIGALNLDNQFEFVVRNLTTGVNYTEAVLPVERLQGPTINLPLGFTFTRFRDVVIDNIQVNAGDVLDFAFNNYAILYNSVAGNFVQFLSNEFTVITGTRVEFKPQSVSYGFNSLVNFTNFFNVDMKQKDFMLDLVKTFNLWIDLDTDGKHIVKTRDAFLQPTVENLDAYLNTEVEVNYQPMGLLDANPYILGYKEDTDSLNSRYKFANQENYGTKQYTIDNDFIKSPKEINVTYSPTPMRYFNQSAMTLCDITFFDKEGNLEVAKKNNYRLLRYEGIKPCNTYILRDTIAQVTLQTGFPLIGHIDDPLNPTLDGLFGLLKFHYLNPAIKYSNNNLFYQYHLQQYAEVTNKNSKLVTATFNITPDLFTKLGFEKVYFFDNSYFRLNKIYDYVPFGDTKLEFLKLINYIKPLASNSTGNGGSGDADNFDEDFPIGQRIANPRNNTGLGAGKDNTIGDTSFAVGNLNRYQGVGTVSVINGSNNIVQPQVQKATIINQSDKIIEANGVYIDGQNIVIDALPTTGAEPETLYTKDGFVLYGTSTVPATVGFLPEAVRVKTANQIINSLASVDIADLNFDIVAGKTYLIKLTAMYQTAVTTTGIRLGAYLTSGVATVGGFIYGAISTGTVATELKAPMRLIGASELVGSFIITTGVSAINTPHSCGAEFYLSCTTTGVLQFQMASEVAGSNAQFNQGSVLIIKTLN